MFVFIYLWINKNSKMKLYILQIFYMAYKISKYSHFKYAKLTKLNFIFVQIFYSWSKYHSNTVYMS